MIHKNIEDRLVVAPCSYGASAPSIYIETLGMDDSEARIMALEFETLWLVSCYAPATADEVKREKRVKEWNPAFG